jgi:hypothetical protein
MTANTTEKTKPFSVYLTDSERQELNAWAEREGRSSTAQARIAIRDALARVNRRSRPARHNVNHGGAR